MVKLGSTDLVVSRLAFGTGTNGWSGRSDQSDLGVEKLAGLLQFAFEQGVNFWDTADAYGTHPHVARALENIPREKVVLVSKTLSRKADRVQKDIDRFLKELNTDYIDILLLHVMTQSDWAQKYEAALEVLTRAKEQGKIRALGVSCHGFGALRATLNTDWCEVVMARINYAGVNMDAAPAKVVPVLEKLYSAGKAVYGMKVVGNGQLAQNVEKAIEYVLNLGSVHTITLGMMNEKQLAENFQLVRQYG